MIILSDLYELTLDVGRLIARNNFEIAISIAFPESIFHIFYRSIFDKNELGRIKSEMIETSKMVSKS